MERRWFCSHEFPTKSERERVRSEVTGALPCKNYGDWETIQKQKFQNQPNRLAHYFLHLVAGFLIDFFPYFLPSKFSKKPAIFFTGIDAYVTCISGLWYQMKTALIATWTIRLFKWYALNRWLFMHSCWIC